jgi:acyl-homoserine-lactone acylase
MRRNLVRGAGLSCLLLLASCATPQPAGRQDSELTRWQRQAERVTITRDDWGIAHIRGRTDADAVFGMIYAQAEDDFNRVESNYLTALGRRAEAEGEKAIWGDLRARLFADPVELQGRYAASPDWLKRLMNAWADGLNFYLATHPEVRPKAITRFEPWMALSFTEGSIGADIERISPAELEAFYGKERSALRAQAEDRALAAKEPTGSNGFAIAPANSANGKALLLINPHTSFFFRSEQQMTSDEGLNAYGASTWGQFFIYQGFNDGLGWMHTTSGVDSVDEFLETVVERDDRLFYRYGSEMRPLQTSTVALRYRAPDGTMASRSFQVYRTHHGPIVREQDGRWVSIGLMHKPIEALSQSYLRTKARSFADYMRVMEHKANSSNNTIYADADGTIAYLHPQFVPVRDDRFDYTKPVDGSDPRTDWRGLHSVASLPFVRNPANGWIQNTNNWPYSAAGPYSPKRESFPRYMDVFGENPRGLHAQMVLKATKAFTLDTLRDAAYDPYQPGLATLVPTLIESYDRAPRSHALKNRLAGPIDALRAWNMHWGVGSIPNTVATFWAAELGPLVTRGTAQGEVISYLATRTTPEQKLRALDAAVTRLERDFGRWAVPWGEVNRFQRLTGDIVQPFSDTAPSIPVGFTTGNHGSLAVFGAARHNDSKRLYGTRGNSFVAVVEFGARIRARAVSAGGQSGNPASPHFNDQAERYATGNLRPVYFYPDEMKGHIERSYKPGR